MAASSRSGAAQRVFGLCWMRIDGQQERRVRGAPRRLLVLPVPGGRKRLLWARVVSEKTRRKISFFDIRRDEANKCRHQMHGSMLF